MSRPTHVEHSREHGLLTIGTAAYRLTIAEAPGELARSPYARLYRTNGERWSKLCLLASVDTTTSPDETYLVAPVVSRVEEDSITLEVVQESSVWASKTLTITCLPDRVELAVRVTVGGRAPGGGPGEVDITDLTLCGGRGVLETGAAGVFRSSIEFASLFVPGPTEPVAFFRTSAAGAVLGVVGDADPGRLHGIFSPPPLAFGFCTAFASDATKPPDGDWLGVSLRESVQRSTFTTVAYEPVDGGFLLRAGYEGHTRVSGTWSSPTLVLRPSSDCWGVLDDHRDDLLTHGFVQPNGSTTADWWSEPLFCGWGAQCARSADTAGAASEATPASSLARQDVYDDFLDILDRNSLDPGTIVIDDRWQETYGLATPDKERWPDLKGWIAARHAEGRRVLLWWKAWDPDGLPVEECVRDRAGRAVSVDPSNPRYRAHLERIVHSLLSPEGLDADGFKVDFTQRAPSGQSLRGEPGGSWGIAALHELLDTLYRSAKSAKRDALVVTHAITPLFADVSDMVRLNDVLERDESGIPVPVVSQLEVRARIAQRCLPHHLVDTDQWPMPNRAEWLDYVEAQPRFGVPALYYLETIDRTGEELGSDGLAAVARSWAQYRSGRANADG